MHEILSVVVERNIISEVTHCRRHLLESWQQLVEVTLTTVVTGEGRGKATVLFELIQDLLLKVGLLTHYACVLAYMYNMANWYTGSLVYWYTGTLMYQIAWCVGT